ncbi:E3 ubiquitin-protein ligase [Astathelohania contejeani]|uniref:E3 ubiquitin-protein ligase n=1 Tax=Astathelohania contejeani TaxID=164912 RepID=A0ABQ7HZN6_9MICR|nr:E3 ubiquitin-protein ligase [Thelohania contejeani]
MKRKDEEKPNISKKSRSNPLPIEEARERRETSVIGIDNLFGSIVRMVAGYLNFNASNISNRHHNTPTVPDSYNNNSSSISNNNTNINDNTPTDNEISNQNDIDTNSHDNEEERVPYAQYFDFVIDVLNIINDVDSRMGGTPSFSIHTSFYIIHNKKKKGITNEQLKNIPTEKISKDDNDKLNEECMICLDNYKVNEKIRILNCDHYFHTKCVDKWLCGVSGQCPTCRKDVI